VVRVAGSSPLCPVATGCSCCTWQAAPAPTSVHRSAPDTTADPGPPATAPSSCANPRGVTARPGAAAAAAPVVPAAMAARSVRAPATTVASSTSVTVLWGAYRTM
jgi:hypothetical protein